MILDLFVIFIILLFMFLGFKNGFVRTLFNSFGWILAIILAMMFSKQFKNFLLNFTTIYDRLEAKADKVISGVVDKYLNGGDYNLPSVVEEGIDKVNDKVTIAVVQNFTEAAFAIFAFILLLIILKLIFFIITILLSKRFHRGFVGGFDGIFGSFLGLAQGAIVILVILAVITPASLLINPTWYNWVSNSLEESVFTAAIYDNNPFKVMVDNFVPSEFMPSIGSSGTDSSPLPDVNNLR